MGVAVVAIRLVGGVTPLAVTRHGAGAVHAQAPLGDVVVMGAPVGHLAAGVFVPPAELVMAALLDIGNVGRRAFPEVPVEAFGNGSFGERAADRIVADPGLDGVDLADPAVADELAGQAVAGVGALLAAGLEDAVILPRGLDHRLAFVDGQARGFSQ